MSTKEETKKGGVTMRGKNQNQDTNDPRKIPAEYLDENGNWRMLDRRERAMLTDGQLYAYERYWLAVVDERILREAAAKKGYNEGMEKGLAEGMEKGLAEGMEKGMEKGMEEGRVREKLENARSLKNNGIPIDLISKSLNLSIEEIEKM